MMESPADREFLATLERRWVKKHPCVNILSSLWEDPCSSLPLKQSLPKAPKVCRALLQN